MIVKPGDLAGRIKPRNNMTFSGYHPGTLIGAHPPEGKGDGTGQWIGNKRGRFYGKGPVGFRGIDPQRGLTVADMGVKLTRACGGIIFRNGLFQCRRIKFKLSCQLANTAG